MSRPIIDIDSKTNIHGNKICCVFDGIWKASCITSCWNRIKQSLLYQQER